MHQQHINLSVVPGLLILHGFVDPHPEVLAVLFQRLQDAVTVMLVAVESQAVLSVQLLQQLQIGLQLAVMDRHDVTIIAIHSTVAHLQEFSHKNGGRGGGDDILVHLQQQVTLKLVIGPAGFGIQQHRHLMLDEVRQLQVVLRFHGDADVRNGIQHSALRTVFGLVGKNLCAAPLVRVKITLTVGAQGLPQALSAVQQVNLCPQVNEALRGRRAGQQDHPLDETPHPPHGFPALALAVLKAGALIKHHHVKGPGLFVVVHQPLHIFPVDDIDVRRSVEGFDALGGAAQHHRGAEVLEVVPLGGLLAPGGLCHLFGSHYQDLLHLPAKILENIDR